MPSALLQMDSVPLVGAAPAFPWETFSAKLSELFAIPELRISPSQTIEWRSPEEFKAGLGDNPKALYITLEPSLKQICWAMADQDVLWLMTTLLKQESISNTGSIEPAFLEGFYQFLAIEALDILMQSEYDKTLSPQLESVGTFPNEPALCQEVTISVNERTLTGRLILPNEFLQQWKQRYVKRSMDISQPIAEHLNVTVHIEAGNTSLTPKEWAKVHVGDFIFLDFCSLKSEEEGRVMLTVNGSPLFRAKIKDGNIKILEHPLHHEGETP